MTTRRTRARAAALTAAATVIATAALLGCSDSTTDSDATPTTPSVQITGPEGTATVPASENPIPQEELWDPCSLPQEVKDSIQLDARTRNDDSLPPSRICSYGSGLGGTAKDPSYGVNVLVSPYSFDEMKSNDKYTNIRPATVGDGHAAFLADTKGTGAGTNKSGVNIVWGTSFGSVAVSVFPETAVPVDLDSLLDTFVSSAYPYIPT